MLYTIIPYELIFEQKEDIKNNYFEMIYEDKHLLVEKIDNGNYMIHRLYSTNPLDYLDKRYSPGNIINIHLKQYVL